MCPGVNIRDAVAVRHLWNAKGLRRTEFKIGGETIVAVGRHVPANFEFCTSEPRSGGWILGSQ